MAVVIRLQGLRITAGSQDIRKFFTGLKIPDGGVHIIGGDREEAFIIFASDEDARRAMTRSGGFIQGSQVTLLLSSKTEMQNVLERSTRDTEQEPQRPREEKATFARRPVDPDMSRRSAGRCDFAATPRRHAASNWNEDSLYVFLRGMPFSVTEEEVYNFFGGLHVDGIVLFKNERGLKNGRGLVKFASREDARDSLKRDREYIGTRYVEIFPASEDDWCQAGGARPSGVNEDRQFEREHSPAPKRGKPQRPGRSRSPPAERRPTPSDDEEFCILLENLSEAVEKDDIKRLFRSANLEDDQILCLTGEDGKRTRSAFVLFTNRRDYCDAVAYEKRPLFNRWIYVHPISRKKMLTILESSNVDVSSSGKPGRFEGRPTSNPGGSYESKKLCVFVQNLSPDVRKVEIVNLFFEFNVAEDDVFLLGDDSGSGMGKALVLFRSEAMAARALSLSGTRVHGVEVTLKCVSPSQIWDCGVEPSVLEASPSGDAFQGRWSKASNRSVESDHRISNDLDGPMNDESSNIHASLDYDSFGTCPQSPEDGGDFSGAGHGSSSQHFDGPTCIKLFNLPFQIRSEEIYDFCYGFRVIPGSVSLQYDESGAPQGTATLVFETRQEATAAVQELSGRPIGPRKVQLLFV